ncbi:prepilin-type N-terminal cleavage/methylation domain-containing protein [Athalassotoga saccharophila]|uniref:prepilin-type N-terminal cleavage/methylation domain-containing protein n=1 Tax=Athalassotoga saccharophila TaxID=1441386 RepID=UPI00137A4A51|nr:prepilin-type N-terminal cleavage/methylation domain-containing protein [Athalassotoga saccharophila]
MRRSNFRSAGFSLVELLIVLAIIAAIISAFVPIGVMIINQARSLTVATNLSEITVAVMQSFYLDRKIPSGIDELSPYFGDQSKILKDYDLSVSKSGTLTIVNVWYKNPDITASSVSKYSPSIIATGNNLPMERVILLKNW